MNHVMNKKLLIVWHTQGVKTAQMAEAVARGARAAAEGDPLEVVLKRAAEAGVDDLLGCQGLIVGTPENFGYMAGMVKDFFDRVYYPCEGKLDALPYSVFVCAGNDGSGAMFNVDRIATGLKLKKVHAGVIAKKEITAEVLAQCEELGATLAAGIAMGIF